MTASLLGHAQALAATGPRELGQQCLVDFAPNRDREQPRARTGQGPTQALGQGLSIDLAGGCDPVADVDDRRLLS